MNYKLLTCLLSVFVLSPLRASIYEVFKLKTAKDLPAGSGAEREPVTIEDIPDEIGNIIAQKIIADNPQFNEAAKTFKVLQGHTNYVHSVAWSPDGTKLASGSRGNTIMIWDAVSGMVLQTLQDHRRTVNSVAWSPDGTKLASGSGDTTIKIWDTVSGSVLQTLQGHTGGVMSVAWSPDGNRLASGSLDNIIIIWDAVSGSVLQTLTGHTNFVYSVAWSPDGTKLASGSWDNTIIIWDVVSGSVLQTLQGHKGWVESVAWSPDGTKLASGSWDNTIIIWDAVSGSMLQTLQGHTTVISSVAWSPDGTKLTSGSLDSTIKIWNIYLLSPTDIENITLEQFLLLKLLYAKRPTYAYARKKPIYFNIPMHKQLSVEEAQRIFNTFSDEARNRIIKRYNIVGYITPAKSGNGAALQLNYRRRARPIQRCPIQ